MDLRIGIRHQFSFPIDNFFRFSLEKKTGFLLHYMEIECATAINQSVCALVFDIENESLLFLCV